MADFAFIVHSRNRTDLPRKFPWLRHVPIKFFDYITLHLPPFVVSKISGLVSREGKLLTGVVIGIPMTAHQLLEHREKALRRIIQAVKKAKSRGAKYIGLGAMTASLSKGGKDVIEQVNGVCVTTGRTFTIINITNYIEYCLERFNLDRNTVRIGIVGAAGGIGSGVAISLARKNYRNLLLIDLERKLSNLKQHITVLENHSKSLHVDLSHKVGDVISCDIVVTATSSPEIVIRSEDIKVGTIIVNDAQPSDISPEILRNRPDVLIIEGGVLHAENINSHFNFGLVHKNDVFSCLAETLLLSYVGSDKHYSIDGFDPDLYSMLEGVAAQLRFSPCMQNDLGIIDENRLQDFARIISSR
ncbi:MAG: hypothetical protein WCG02_03555 [Candidatus Taylorbacteria bacterium]